MRRIAATGRMLLKLVYTKVNVEKRILCLFAISDFGEEKNNNNISRPEEIFKEFVRMEFMTKLNDNLQY